MAIGPDQSHNLGRDQPVEQANGDQRGGIHIRVSLKISVEMVGRRDGLSAAWTILLD